MDLSSTYDIGVDDIVIVVLMLESWYYAGLSTEACRELDIEIYADANIVSKQNLQHQAQKNQLTRKQLLSEILDYFDLQKAKQQNQSFHYFIKLLEELIEISNS